MATYIQGLTGIAPQTPLYTPDYAFLDQKLRMKDAMYEQGVSQARSFYNSVRTAALTKDENKLTRDQYLKDAQDNLKKIAASDLSLVENQQAANNVFAPFWEDQDILTDYMDTKQQSAEMQKQYAMQDSADENVRNTFSNIPLTLMQDRMSKIKSSKRGDMSAYSTPMVKSTPFYDIYREAEKFVKDNDWKITRINSVNGRIETVTNGAGTEMTYAQLAEQLRGTKYQAQDDMMGRYQKMLALDNIKRDYNSRGVEITDEQAAKYIPDYYSGNHVKSLSDARGGLAQRKQLLAKKLKEMEANPGVDPNEFQEALTAYEQLDNTDKDYDNQIKTWSNKDSEEYKRMAENISYSPEKFFAQSYRQAEINKAARLLASKQTQKVEIDQSYWKNIELQQDARLEYDKMQNARILQEMKDDDDGSGSGSGSSGSGGSGKGSMPYSDINNDGIPDIKQKEQVNMAYNTPTVENAKSSIQTLNPVADAKNFIFNRRQEAVADSFSLFRNAPASLISKYLTSEEASTLYGVTINKVKQKDYDATMKTVRERLLKNGVIKKDSEASGPMNVMNLVSDRIIRDVEESVDNANKYPSNAQLQLEARKGLEMWKQLSANREKLNNLYAKEKQFNQDVDKEMSKPGYEKVRVKQDNGFSIVTSQYLADTYKVPKAVSDAYMTGKLKVDDENVYTYAQTPTGPLTRILDHTNYYANIDGKKYDVTGIVTRFGESKELKKNLDDASAKASKVVNSSFFNVFKDETAAMGRVITYRSDGDNKKIDMGQEVANDILNTGMKYEQEDDKSVRNFADDSDTKEFAENVLQRIRSNPGEGLTDIKLYPISPINSNKRAVRLNYSVEQLKKLFDEKTFKEKASEINKLASEGILLELRDNEQVKGFPTAASRGYYEMLLTENTGKKIIKSSPLEEKLGVKYELYRDYEGQIRYKAVTKVVTPDPNNPGQVMERWVDPQDPNISEDQVSEKNMPAGVDPENFVRTLQLSAGNIYTNNARVVSNTVKPRLPISQSNPALYQRFKNLGIK